MACNCREKINEFWDTDKCGWEEESWAQVDVEDKIETMRTTLPVELVPCLCETDEECLECKCPVCIVECHPECEITEDNFPPTMERVFE